MKKNKQTLRVDQTNDENRFGEQITAVTPPQNRVFLQARWARNHFGIKLMLNRCLAMQCSLVLLLMPLVLLSGRAMASPYEYDIKSVNYKNLVATLYLPKTKGKTPVVVAFGGSDGGMNFGDANGKMIAPYGVAVLALAFFKAGNLPPTLDDIPMEYFVSSIDYLQSEPAVDSSRIGVVSGSRGSEAALLLASFDRRIKSVVVTTPSYVSWGGMGKSASAWTFAGKPVPFLQLGLDETVPRIKRFESALGNKIATDKATIPMERINGPIFVVSAKADEIWPSYQMSLAIESYLSNHNFRYSVTHASYPTGHMFSAEVAPEIKQSIVDHFVRTLGPVVSPAP